MARVNNSLFGINKFPTDWGLLMFPLSMTRLSNSQSPEQLIEYIKKINRENISVPLVGINFLYTTSLYFHYNLFSSSSYKGRLKWIQEASKHKNHIRKLIKKNTPTEFQIPWAIDFITWEQILLSMPNFPSDFKQIKNLYEKDILFQNYTKLDSEEYGRELTEAQIDFMTEENIIIYFLAKNNLFFHNNHVQNRQTWILSCYPGKPPRSLIYLFQLNPLKLKNPQNKYETVCQYNLEDGLLYDATRIDLENYSMR